LRSEVWVHHRGLVEQVTKQKFGLSVLRLG